MLAEASTLAHHKIEKKHRLRMEPRDVAQTKPKKTGPARGIEQRGGRVGVGVICSETPCVRGLHLVFVFRPMGLFGSRLDLLALTG